MQSRQAIEMGCSKQAEPTDEDSNNIQSLQIVAQRAPKGEAGYLIDQRSAIWMARSEQFKEFMAIEVPKIYRRMLATSSKTN